MISRATLTGVVPGVALLLLFAPAPEPPIIQAVRSGNPAILKQLLERKEGLNAIGSNGQTALHEAAAACSLWSAELLVAAGVDRTVRDKFGNTAATIAADCPPTIDRVKLVRAVSAAVPRDGGNQEQFGWSLQNAVARGDLNVATMLLKMGADVNAVGDQGNRALEIAARKGNAAAVQLLLANGASATLKTAAGTTVLHEAALGGNAAVIEALASKGADVNAVDKDNGQTPLHYAASFDRADAVKALLQAKADPTRRDAKGRTALDLAKSENRAEIVKLLQQTR